MKFLDKLTAAVRNNNSLLCVGLDPDPSRLPPGVGLLDFNKQIIEATKDTVCAYKINLAFFEAMGDEGYQLLKLTRDYIPADIPVIADAKRGDIGNTSKAYAKAVFDNLGFDAITVHPYMGLDSISPFLDYTNRGIFILCRTSNPGSNDFQNLPCLSIEGQVPLYKFVARKAQEWNRYSNIGLVVGATYPEELKEIRKTCPDMPLLIPGVGPQGGDLGLAVTSSINNRGEGAIINSSRQIIYASLGSDFALKAREAAINMKKEINRHRRPGCTC